MVYPTPQNPSWPIRAIPALFICLAIFFPVAAVAVEGEQEKQQGLPSHIQLKPIMVPITGARQHFAPITVFIHATSKKYIQKICFYRPRIVDAVLQVLSRHPIRVIRRKLDLENFPAQVLAPINKALGAEIVWAVFVVPGAVSMGYNNGLFNFTASSCKIINENEAHRKKAAAARENS